MKSDLRILFLGNHTVGVRAMDVLSSEAKLVGVVAHPDDPEDGVRYESVFSAAQKLRLPVLRANGKSQDLKNFISNASPDLLWITDYRYLLPGYILNLSRLGAVNLHPSLLPKYRGRAPVNWAIIHGETRLGLTAHWVDTGMDTGDIIAQKSFNLNQTQDVADALQMLYPIYQSITSEVVQAINSGEAARFKQNEAEATVFPKRSLEDGLIDWSQPASRVWNLVRAVAPPYPGAFAHWQGGKLWVHRISRAIPFPSGNKPTPGSLIEGDIAQSKMVVACIDCSLEIDKFIFEADSR